MIASAIEMRNPCRFCGETRGSVVTKDGQDCVYCASCRKYAGYNAPRTETGRRERSAQTVHAGIKPAQRARIIERANARCELCGKSAEMCSASGDANLICSCDECNLGIGRHSLALRQYLRILSIREDT